MFATRLELGGPNKKQLHSMPTCGQVLGGGGTDDKAGGRFGDHFFGGEVIMYCSMTGSISFAVQCISHTVVSQEQLISYVPAPLNSTFTATQK